MSDDAKSFDPDVLAMLGEMEDGADGPELPGPKLRVWGDRFAAHERLETIAPHLVVLASRFLEAGKPGTAVQLAGLASHAWGRGAPTPALAGAGVIAEQAKRLVATAEAMRADKRGVAPPTGGVGFRTQRR